MSTTSVKFVLEPGVKSFVEHDGDRVRVCNGPMVLVDTYVARVGVTVPVEVCVIVSHVGRPDGEVED